MTLPVERTRALLKAAELLNGLVSRGVSFSRAELRILAADALHHFPTTYDIDQLAERSPELLASVPARTLESDLVAINRVQDGETGGE